MDVEQLPLCLDLLSHSGVTLNHEKYNLLMNSLVILQNENQFKKVYFWGQIFGTKQDYYIAFGYKKDALRGRLFYYSRNAINWVLMPIIPPKSKIHYLSYICLSQFYGNPPVKIDIFDDAPIEDKPKVSSSEGEEEDLSTKQLNERRSLQLTDNHEESTKRYSIEEIKEHYKLKEEDRLAATVRFINQEAAIIPRGALFKQTDGYVVPNPAFQGLEPGEALDLSSYLHYRTPVQRWELNVGRRPDYNYATDFLDTIAEDIPRNNVWSAHIVQGNRAVTLYNLYWPGFTFYHLLNSKIHGFVYMGFGLRNIDLPFMV